MDQAFTTTLGRTIYLTRTLRRVVTDKPNNNNNNNTRTIKRTICTTPVTENPRLESGSVCVCQDQDDRSSTTSGDHCCRCTNMCGSGNCGRIVGGGDIEIGCAGGLNCGREWFRFVKADAFGAWVICLYVRVCTSIFVCMLVWCM